MDLACGKYINITVNGSVVVQGEAQALSPGPYITLLPLPTTGTPLFFPDKIQTGQKQLQGTKFSFSTRAASSFMISYIINYYNLTIFTFYSTEKKKTNLMITQGTHIKLN